MSIPVGTEVLGRILSPLGDSLDRGPKLMTKKSKIVDPSPWPLLGAFSALSLTCGGVLYMHNYNGGGFLLLLGFTSLVLTMFLWWFNKREAYSKHNF